MDSRMQEEVVEDLSHALRALAAAERAMPVGPDRTGRLLRLARTIDALGGLPDMVMGKLQSAHDFTAYAMSRITEQQAEVIRPIVVEWLNKVRADAQGGSGA